VSTTSAPAVPLGVYLETSYRPDREYLDGELLARNVGEWDHSKLQARLIVYLSQLTATGPIHVVPEQRVQVRRSRFRVPDIAVIVGPEPAEQILTAPPFLCIEILSRSDRMQEMQERIDDYLAFGVRYVWLVHPRARRAFIYTPEGVREVKDGWLSTENPAIRVSLAELA
jgi:Uma2 family endonuclease